MKKKIVLNGWIAKTQKLNKEMIFGLYLTRGKKTDWFCGAWPPQKVKITIELIQATDKISQDKATAPR